MFVTLFIINIHLVNQKIFNDNMYCFIYPIAILYLVIFTHIQAVLLDCKSILFHFNGCKSFEK